MEKLTATEIEYRYPNLSWRRVDSLASLTRKAQERAFRKMEKNRRRKQSRKAKSIESQ